MSNDNNSCDFRDFGLSKPLIQALDHIGYEKPSPIQEKCIPALMNQQDIIGQAQTGTGKTAAFALPLLHHVNIDNASPQALILAPTRELAIQVAEAIQSYAHFMQGFHVLPIYGGQSYSLQLRPLKRGVHVVVGTPGRIMDHINRGTLQLENIKTLVLDEADEMLRMGFIDDVEEVMGLIPEQRQIALFSATMPNQIRKIAEKFLNKPQIIKVESKTTTAPTIRQRYWQVSGVHKLDALTRILEVQDFDALLIFVRTKTATIELAEKLSARGFAAEAINGDILQKQRERLINQLKQGKIDILVATDVAARGLDVERISLVINYDIPHDPESYVHRIGRTGRAGKHGDAILFVAPRERRMLKTIEKITKQVIEPMQLPSVKLVNEQRINLFKQKITNTLLNEDLYFFEKIIADYHHETGKKPLEIAAALAQLVQGKESLLITEKTSNLDNNKNIVSREKTNDKFVTTEAIPLKDFPEIDMCRYQIDVGHNDNVKPKNIVGAIANEAEIESCYIGTIDIYDTFSTIDLPEGMPKEVFKSLKNTWVCNKKLNIKKLSENNVDQNYSKANKKNKKKSSTKRNVKRNNKKRSRSK